MDYPVPERCGRRVGRSVVLVVTKIFFALLRRHCTLFSGAICNKNLTRDVCKLIENTLNIITTAFIAVPVHSTDPARQGKLYISELYQMQLL